MSCESCRLLIDFEGSDHHEDQHVLPEDLQSLGTISVHVNRKRFTSEEWQTAPAAVPEAQPEVSEKMLKGRAVSLAAG